MSRRNHPHGWRGLRCGWCRRICRTPRRNGQHLRYHSPHRHPGARLVVFLSERGGQHHLWTWRGTRRRTRIVEAP